MPEGNFEELSARASGILDSLAAIIGSGESGEYQTGEEQQSLFDLVLAAVDERLIGLGIALPEEGEAGDGQGQPVGGEAPAEQPIPPAVATELAAMQITIAQFGEQIVGMDQRVAQMVQGQLAGIDERLNDLHRFINAVSTSQVRLGSADDPAFDTPERRGYGGS